MTKHPLYLAWCLFVLIWLFLANQRGWSFVHSIKPSNWGNGARGIHHK